MGRRGMPHISHSSWQLAVGSCQAEGSRQACMADGKWQMADGSTASPLALAYWHYWI